MPQPFDLPDAQALSTEVILARVENGHAADAPYDPDAAHADDDIQEIVGQEGHVQERNEHDNLPIANETCSYAFVKTQTKNGSPPTD